MITLNEVEFNKFYEYVKSNYGINLIEKANLIEGRLQNVLVEKGFESFNEFFKYLIKDETGDAIITLINKITTNHTFFLRESDHFSFLKEKVLPYLEKSQTRTKDLRIWSAGCSSGEEPYTLAMLIADYFGSQKHMWDSKILATDISQNVLEAAKKGVYLEEQLANIPAVWKMNYFKKLDNQKSSVADNIKNEVIFRSFNLMNSIFPFKQKFHIIFCRNVMIYFDNETKIDLINKFYEITEPGGYLFIGHSETINTAQTKYKYVLPSVYRKE